MQNHVEKTVKAIGTYLIRQDGRMITLGRDMRNSSQKFTIARDIGKVFKNKYEVIETDGFRINFPHGWGLIRASNTQPVLVLKFESQSKGGLREIMETVNTKPLKYDCFSTFDLKKYNISLN